MIEDHPCFAAALSVMALGAASPASAKSNFSLYIGTPG